MRQPDGFSSWRFWSLSTILMIVLTVCFALQQINIVYIRWPVDWYLALSADGLKSFYVWQLATYMFLHGGLLHLAFNLLGLWFFGRTVENYLGRNKFLIIYFASGLCGGLLQAGLGLLFPGWFGHFTYGSSAGVCGLLAVYCLLEPDSQILLFFVLPLKARVLLWVSIGIAAFFTVVPSDPCIAHTAHLGGLLFGLGFMRLGLHREFIHFDFNFNWLWRWKSKPSKITKVNFGKSRPPAAAPETLTTDVDVILDKISAQGIQSLTEAERKILEAARKKMG
jgi:membrane associated rhomboid family serine protease